VHGMADEVVPFLGRSHDILGWSEDWAERNRCLSGPDTFFEAERVLGRRWGDCEGDAVVELYTIEGSGHIWPGSSFFIELELSTRDLVAADVIWDFFIAHPMP